MTARQQKMGKVPPAKGVSAEGMVGSRIVVSCATLRLKTSSPALVVMELNEIYCSGSGWGREGVGLGDVVLGVEILRHSVSLSL